MSTNSNSMVGWDNLLVKVKLSAVPESGHFRTRYENVQAKWKRRINEAENQGHHIHSNKWDQEVYTITKID